MESVVLPKSKSELLRRASELAEALPEILAGAATHPWAVQRAVLVLTPRSRFFEWHNQWNANIKGYRPIEEGAAPIFTRAFLVSCTEASESSATELLRAHAASILGVVCAGYMPRHRWPWTPCPDEIEAWFTAVLASGLHDLAGGEIQKHVDDAHVCSEL
jgi:hypothetical protein